MEWYEAPGEPNWRRGFPGKGGCARGKYGYWIETHETPWSASITIWRSFWEYRESDLSKALYDEDLTGKVLSWKGWFKRRKLMDSKLKKALEKARAANKPRETTDEGLGKTHPLLCGFLTSTEGLEKGKHREPGTLFLFTADGRWKGVLGEKDPEASLWGAGDTFQGLLDDLEKALGSDEPDWRVKSARGNYSVKKGKGGGRG